jgi:putative oxidoreductase
MKIGAHDLNLCGSPRNHLAFFAGSDKPSFGEGQDMNALFQSSAPSSSQLNAALLILRVASALAFLYHGSAILFGAFGGPGPVGFAGFLHMPVAVGYLVGLAQFAGGLAILSGVLFRVGAASVAIVMLGAIFLVHLPHGFDINKGGLEYALTQGLIALAFLFTGPGEFSLNSSLPASLRKL